MSNPNASTPNTRVICVYTYETLDESDVKRVRQSLRDIGISRKIPYKADNATRAADALSLSLVAVLREQIVGPVTFSELGSPAQSGWLALGPVAVEPPLQRRGVGSQPIEAGLQAIREQGAKGCVLVGNHRYYHRFGFVVAPAFAPPRYPLQHFQVLRFGDSFPDAPAAFHPAFSAAAPIPSER